MRVNYRRFVPDLAELEQFLQSLKQQRCPFCGQLETLNRHAKITGYDPQARSGCIFRGQRVYCSPRGRRGGCGRSFPALLAVMFPRHLFNAWLLWKALVGWLRGTSIKASWETGGSPLTLDGFYHLLQRLRRRVDAIRTGLHTCAPPPESRFSDPLRATFEHLRGVFTDSLCPPESFQLKFQRSFVG